MPDVAQRRRMNPRFAIATDADLTTLPNGAPIAAQLTELSVRGCYVDTVKPVAVNTEVRLRIQVGEKTCELPGKVIYAHSGYGTGLYGIGVVFGELNNDQNSTIAGWIDQLSGKVTQPAASSPRSVA